MNFKIKNTLTSHAGGLAFVILLQSIIGNSQLQLVNDNTLDLSKNWLPSTRELNEIKHRITRLYLVEVTSNIAGVAQPSEDTGAAVSQVLSAALKLSRQSEHLAAVVGMFLTSVRVA